MRALLKTLHKLSLAVAGKMVSAKQQWNWLRIQCLKQAMPILGMYPQSRLTLGQKMTHYFYVLLTQNSEGDSHTGVLVGNFEEKP